MKMMRAMMKVMRMNGDVNIVIEHSQLHLGAGFTRNPVNKRILNK
jgi:hypothetical protein